MAGMQELGINIDMHITYLEILPFCIFLIMFSYIQNLGLFSSL